MFSCMCLQAYLFVSFHLRVFQFEKIWFDEASLKHCIDEACDCNLTTINNSSYISL